MKSYIYYFRTGKKIKYLDTGGQVSEADLRKIAEQNGLPFDDMLAEAKAENPSDYLSQLQKNITAEGIHAGEYAADYAMYGGPRDKEFDVKTAVEKQNKLTPELRLQQIDTFNNSPDAQTSTGATVSQLQNAVSAISTTIAEKTKNEDKPKKRGLSADAKKAIASASIAGFNAVDDALMGDKNFGALSAAIDSAVHTTSSALMKSGNPYAMCCLKDTVVFTSEGKPVLIQNLKKDDGILGYYNKEIIAQPIEELFPPLYKESILIETENGNILRCSIDHPIYSAPEGRARYFTVGKKKQRRIKEFSFKRADKLKVGDFVAEAGSIPFFGDKEIKLAYLIGMLIGDGTYGKGKAPRLFTGDSCTWKWLEDNNLGKITAHYFPGERYNKEFREYSFHGFQPLLKELGIYGQTKKNKRLPVNLHTWNKKSCAALIAGLFDTDGFVSSNDKLHAGISFALSNLELLKEIKLLLLKFGIHCTILKHKAKDKFIKKRLVHSGESFVLNIKTRESVINFYNNITLNIDYKLERLQKAYLLKLDTKARDTSLEFHNVVADKIKRIIHLGFCEVYNLCAGISHTYLAEGIVTHNTAAAALEGANFLTKATGETVLGFDVDINSSGYGNIGHKDSVSNRDWLGALGFSGIYKSSKIDRQLQKRNEEARQAVQAASVADELNYEQEARAHSIEDVISQNQVALNGGVDLNSLIAKNGGKLNKLQTRVNLIAKALNGAKLKNIETSDELNLLPVGELHKNKHEDFGIDVTKKGIPVITVQDDLAETLEDITAQKETVLQHAEIEALEWIMNKELTDYIEKNREEYHENNNQDLLLEVGKRIAAELLLNTKDTSKTIKKAIKEA